MSNIFCSQCGAKHLIGAKFCSACGNPLSALARPQTQNSLRPISYPIDEDDLPTTFVKPTRLAYEIDSGGNNKYKAEDIFKSNPIPENERTRLKPLNQKRLSKEELLKESLRECAPRGIQDIDET